MSPAQPAEGWTEETQVTLNAVGNEGYVFDHWSGDVWWSPDLTSNINPAHVMVAVIHTPPTMNITAHFAASDARFALTFSVYPASSGRIILAPSLTAEGYLVNEKITVTATANTGYQFNQWGGDLTGSTNPASLVMDRDKTITATFKPLYRPTVNASPIGSGTVTLAPALSAEGYVAGTNVTLTATAGKGYKFDYWSGVSSGSEKANTITIVIGPDQIITANFAKAGGFPSWLLIGVVVVVVVGLPLGFLIMRRLLAAA